jgi:hypothetical protein
MHDEGLREYVNVFANYVRKGAGTISKDIARTAVEEGVSIKGEKLHLPGINYIHEHVLTKFPGRLKTSAESFRLLRSKFPTIMPEDMAFINVHKSIVKREISNARSLREMDFQIDQRAKIKNLTRGRIAKRDLLASQYGWLDSFECKYYECKSEKNLHPFISCHKFVRNMYDSMGVRIGREVSPEFGLRINQYLRRFDRYFPRHHDPEAILRVVTDPHALNDPEVMALCLSAMGMRRDKCDVVAQDLIANKSSILLGGVDGGYSWGDPLFANLPTSYTKSLVDEYDILTTMPRVNVMLSGIFSQGCLIKNMNGETQYRCRLYYSGDGLDFFSILSKLGFMQTIYKSRYKFDPDLHGIYSA